MKNVIGIILLVGAVGGIYALNDATRDKGGKSVLNVAEAVAIIVQVADPSRHDITQTVQAPGSVEALSEVDISAEVVAKILEMPVEEGDTVKKGDLLCRLDDEQYRARLVSAEANVAKLKATIVRAEADFSKADRDYHRQLKLIEQDATSSIELNDYRTTKVRAEAMVEIRQQELIEAQAFLRQAKQDLTRTVITAPIDGVVSQLFAKEGEVVITGTMNNPGTRIMVISDLSEMQIRCRVDESDAALVSEGQIARIFLQTDTEKSISGTVRRIATKGTKSQGRDVVTFETLIRVESTESCIKPGMTASIEIEVASRRDALTVPVHAVVHRKRKDLPEALLKENELNMADSDSSGRNRVAEYLKVIYCIENDVAHPKLIRTGIVDARNVEIVGGLTSADRIVVGPFRSLDQLKDGAKVEIEGDKDKTDKAESGKTIPTETETLAKGN